MTSPTKRPPYYPELDAVLGAMGGLNVAKPAPSLSLDDLPEMRKQAAGFPEDLTRFDVETREFTISGHEGADLLLTVYRRRGQTNAAPGIFHIHGGAMVMGDRFTGMTLVLPWVIEFGVVATTVEYRLAPEFPDPYPVEDSYAALAWVADHAAELGIDPDRLIIAGASAGGGITAGVTLLARDRQGPTLFGQMLICPMLDDRDQTPSTLQYEGLGLHDRNNNRLGWTALLGDRYNTDDVTIYASPARATDLSGLPPTFIDVGGAEVFRDEAVAYASQLWADGGTVELHVWPGGTHGWEAMTPQHPMATQSAEARRAWVARLLS